MCVGCVLAPESLTDINSAGLCTSSEVYPVGQRKLAVYCPGDKEP
ncbi:hypothetical protein ykris0001_5560 [Yersinia kristensenii ATCC 33638]|nr:hypothetical protein ykris0001_5560 [Yersinia kristensenii ATCC 33638]